MCVSETWLTQAIPDAAISFSGYNVFRFDAGSGYGSVCIYTADHLVCKVLKLHEIECQKGLEFIFLDIETVELR